MKSSKREDKAFGKDGFSRWSAWVEMIEKRLGIFDLQEVYAGIGALRMPCLFISLYMPFGNTCPSGSVLPGHAAAG